MIELFNAAADENGAVISEPFVQTVCDTTYVPSRTVPRVVICGAFASVEDSQKLDGVAPQLAQELVYTVTGGPSQCPPWVSATVRLSCRVPRGL